LQTLQTFHLNQAGYGLIRNLGPVKREKPKTFQRKQTGHEFVCNLGLSELERLKRRKVFQVCEPSALEAGAPIEVQLVEAGQALESSEERIGEAVPATAERETLKVIGPERLEPREASVNLFLTDPESHLLSGRNPDLSPSIGELLPDPSAVDVALLKV
jgi:hypothetical protein